MSRDKCFWMEDGEELSFWNYVYKFYFWNEKLGEWWHVYELDFL